MEKIIIGLFSISALIFADSQGMRKTPKQSQYGEYTRIFQPESPKQSMTECTKDQEALTMEDFIEKSGDGSYQLRDPKYALPFIECIKTLWERDPYRNAKLYLEPF